MNIETILNAMERAEFERLFSFMMGRPIRECVAFPMMKPETKKMVKDKGKK